LTLRPPSYFANLFAIGSFSSLNKPIKWKNMSFEIKNQSLTSLTPKAFGDSVTVVATTAPAKPPQAG
jgi:hypothetical protein